MSSPLDVKDDAPDQIVPENKPRTSWAEKGRKIVKTFTTKDGLVGKYDYAFLFTPNIPFMKRQRRAAPFFGLNDRMPVLLALLLGFQHALSMLAGVSWSISTCTSSRLIYTRYHHAAYHSRRLCEPPTGSSVVPGQHFSHRLRHSLIDSNHSIPHLQDTVLHRHGLDLRGRNVIRNHSCRYRSPCTNVSDWVLPF